MNYWWVGCKYNELKVFCAKSGKVRASQWLTALAHSGVTTDNITSFNLYNAHIDLFCVYQDCDQSSQLALMVGDWVN